MLPPVLAARLWRFRAALGLLVLLAAFHLISAFAFEPPARRYERAVRRLGDLGLGAQASGSAAVLPPRVYRLMADNSRPAAEVDQRAASGGLASALLETVTRAMSESGVRLVSTDPGTVTPSTNSVQVRLELQARGSYPQIADFFDRLARSGKLIHLDRFSLMSEAPGKLELQLSLSQHLFKMAGSAP